jgi:AcrR family transcriptional regulator
VDEKLMAAKTEPEPRKDPRVTRTQKLIRDALASLLSEKSFESISVQDIAERATVNRATFYAHFPDKFALLDTIIRDALHERLSEGSPLSRPDMRSMLQIIGKNVFAFVALHSQCKINRDFEPQFQRTMEAELHAFITPKFSDCAALLISSAIVGAAMQWRAKGRRELADHIVSQIVDVLSDGVAKPAH